jgi:hypothetical protein
MSTPFERGRHPYTFFKQAGGPTCWSCGQVMTEVATGATTDSAIWHCVRCDVTERGRG